MFPKWRWSLPPAFSLQIIILSWLMRWTLSQQSIERPGRLRPLCGIQPFHTHMWFATKIYFTSSPQDDECFRSSWGIKSNTQAKRTTVCTWTVYSHDTILSKLYPDSVWLEGRCCFSEHVFWQSRKTAQLLRLCSYEWVLSGSVAHWEPLHCHHPPTILTHLH